MSNTVAIIIIIVALVLIVVLTLLFDYFKVIELNRKAKQQAKKLKNKKVEKLTRDEKEKQ